jgi:hypothetical protein
MYDVIGDVHGQGGKLRALLGAMGYRERHGTWRAPPGRQAVFVGDLIDRGPEQLAVLEIVRRMVEAGQARVVLGNHEFNAIGFLERSPKSGKHYRPRSDRNRAQHARFLAEVGEDSALHREWVDWFKTLPLALDLQGIRVVHGWWDSASVEALERVRPAHDDSPMSAAFLEACHDEASPLKLARKRLTCGVEWDLPEGSTIVSKEGQHHPEARIAVWRHWTDRLREVALVPQGSLESVPDIAIPEELRMPPVEGAPIMFGHHWFSGPVRLETPKVACLDWSAAKDGPLVAYRWDGEAQLKHDRLIAVGGSV